MKTNIKKIVLMALCLVTSLSCVAPAFAGSQFSVSPMNQKIVLNPGETYNGTFKVTNPNDSEMDFKYVASIEPFYVDDNYEAIFKNNGDYNKIVDWLTVEETEGVISPNNTKIIHFTVNVPEDAAAGGQYATIKITSADQEASPGTISIQNKLSIAHLIYAEVAGTTVRKGEIVSTSVPGFLFSGKISGSSTIKNTGNVHGTATYKMQVFPLFSDEEIYTNEEEPEEKTILPDRALSSTSYWNETPVVGVFNVVFTAEFEGVTSQVKKLVIVCPVWLIIIIGAVILLILFGLFSKKRK